MTMDPIMRVDKEMRDLVRNMIPVDANKRDTVKRKYLNSKRSKKSVRDEFYSFTDWSRYAAQKIKKGEWR